MEEFQIKSDIQGIITALITPFNAELEIDHDTVFQLMKYQAMNGVAGVLVSGTTGEFPSITKEEIIQLVETAWESKDKLQLIAGTGRPSFEETINLSMAIQKMVDALLIIPPYYFKSISNLGVYNYYRKILERVKAPIIAYNIPKYTGVSLNNEIIKDLMKFENFLGIKDSSGDLQVTKGFLTEFPELMVLGGSDALILDSLKVGAKGAISALSNVFPGLVNSIYIEFKKKNLEKATEMQERLIKIRETFKQFPQVANFKGYLKSKFYLTPQVRPPLVSLKDDEIKELLETLKEI